MENNWKEKEEGEFIYMHKYFILFNKKNSGKYLKLNIICELCVICLGAEGVHIMWYHQNGSY